MLEYQDLGLSLKLGFSGESCRASETPQNLNLSASSSSSHSSPFHSSPCWADRSSDACGGGSEAAAFLKGIDVNRAPAAAADGEEEAWVSSSSPNNSTVSSGSKRSEREDQETERACSRGISDEEDGGEASRKKLRLTKDQSAILEETFKEHNTLNPKQKLGLAKRLGLRPRQVEVWFQNRRARTKLKQTEVDCEVLKRCCENLTEENRRLHKEIQQLRAFKLSPHFYMQMPPPTTLTMCPSCECVAVPPPASSSPAIYSYGSLVTTNRNGLAKALPLQHMGTCVDPHRRFDVTRPNTLKL
ncbi:PREDICTED: homeobox-leucine zipper protein HAT4-like [Ipomoea nil]|uniref:homeobox-leucine zipper protein HAT4-like n=1 Tax=Ipomoea nil TaxID=35883 RepID=UPI0009019926|nr:PREDICTED: homeobox-leucine zipper protein HAT4-like [Ipomoea nil]